MYSFLNLEPVCCSMSSYNCCFLTCMQISLEADKVFRYSLLLKNFLQFVVILTVKGFSIVNEVEVDVFLEFSSFSYDPKGVGNLIFGTSAFSRSNLNICNFSVLLKHRLENFEHYFASMWDEHSCAVIWTFFGIAFLWDWNENWPFPFLWPLLTKICWHIDCSTFTASSLRIWNSSTGIPSPPLTLFIVMLPRTHLTSHSRISGSRWVITWSWLSGSLKPLLCSSSVYSYHHFLISSASLRSIPFLSFTVPIFTWNVPLVSLIFLKRSLAFPIILFYFFLFLCIEHLGMLSYLSLLFFGILHLDGYISSFLLCLLFLFFSQLFVRPPQTTTLPFCISFSWGWFWSLPPIQCYKPSSIVLQAFCLSDLVPESICHFHCIIIGDLI